jgi:Tn7-like transposition protein D/TniQ
MIGNWPDPYPDELFYSICARFSERLRYPSKRSVVAELFGTDQAIACISLPSHLGYLVSQLPPYYNCDINRIIDQHTLLPYFAPFLPPERYTRLRQDMSSNNGPTLHMRAGLMASRVPLPLWLRFCPRCVEEDRRRFGECYWHRVHQASGVEICPLHKLPVRISSAHARNMQTRYEFIPAENAVPETLPKQFDGSEQLPEILFALASDAQWLLNQQDLSQELVTLQHRYRVRLADLGLSTYRGRIEKNALLSRFKNMYPSELLRLLHCELDEYMEDNWLVRLAHKPDNAQHPLHHLLLIHCLGQTAEAFFRLPTQSKPFGDGPWPCLNPVCRHYRQLQVSECTITHSPYVSGRPIGAFSCTCGFTYLRIGPDTSAEDRFKISKIQTFGRLWEARLSHLWEDETVSLREIARQLGVDPLTIKRHASRLDLPFPRPISRTCRLNEAQKLRPLLRRIPEQSMSEEYRTMWINALQEYQGMGMKFIRGKYAKLYKWLYRHDTAWLKAHLPSRLRAHRQVSLVDWQQRDQQLAQLVEISAQRLRHQVGKPTHITLAAIGRDIGQLAVLQQHLLKLPAVAQLLGSLVETREAFAIRRIQWVTQQYEAERYQPKRWEFIKRAGIERIAAERTVSEVLDEALRKVNFHISGDMKVR